MTIDRLRLAEIIAEEMGHERGPESLPFCPDEDTTLGCQHEHEPVAGCDTCCEYGWPCEAALAAADAVLAELGEAPL